MFTLALATVAALVVLANLLTRDRAIPDAISLPWILIAAGFCAAELKVVDVHFRREKHSFSLNEFPAVIGLFTLTPVEYLVAVLIGSAVALTTSSRDAPIKLAFNLVNFGATATLALSIFHLGVGVSGGHQLGAWASAFAATFFSAVFSAFTIASAISLSGGAPQFQKLPEMIQFGALVAVANTSLALLAVSGIQLQPSLLILLVVPLAVVFLAYRAYLSEREKHEQLELLYQSSRILQHSPELDSAVVALLDHARNMFRAETAEITLYARLPGEDGLVSSASHADPPQAMVPLRIDMDAPIHQRVAAEPHPFFHAPGPSERARTGLRQAMVAPLRGEAGLFGSMMIANRMTEGTSFGDDDIRLLETLANQAAVALENGQLEQSLAELSRLKEQLRHQAYHDPLTNLPNRSLFTEQVDAALANPRPGWLTVVLFLDLDDFKVVNDTLGHAAGDRLLSAVADRFRDCVRDGDLAARLGGDEFAILLQDEADLGRAVAVTNRLLDALRVSFPIEGQEITISASIGIAAGRSDTRRADDLLRNADVAMYTAKEDGKSRFAVFDPTVHQAIVARHTLSSELAKSIARGELTVFYQPIIALRTGETVGVEALVRWRHPSRGLIGPDEFISLAEESGTILQLGHWVLAEACREVAALREVAPAAGLLLTVNLSAVQLKQPTFVEDLELILFETGFPADRLVLEMTETAMFSDTQTTITRLQALRALGVQIAVDDFGTGYSSLGYLRRFQVDVLKIAREFIGSVGGGHDEWAFAHAIVALGRTLGLRIVAEGIEEPGQLDRLRELGCEFGQGYLFARPSDEPTLRQALAQQRRASAAPAALAVAAPDLDRQPIT